MCVYRFNIESMSVRVAKDDAPTRPRLRDGKKMDAPAERVFARSSVAFMIVTEETVNFVGCGDGGRIGRRERCSWSKMGTGVADGGRNQAELKQGQGTRSTGVCFSSAFHCPAPSTRLLLSFVSPVHVHHAPPFPSVLSAYPGDHPRNLSITRAPPSSTRTSMSDRVCLSPLILRSPMTLSAEGSWW